MMSADLIGRITMAALGGQIQPEQLLGGQAIGPVAMPCGLN